MSNGTLSTQRTLSLIFSLKAQKFWTSLISPRVLFLYILEEPRRALEWKCICCVQMKKRGVNDRWMELGLDREMDTFFYLLSCFRNKNAMRIWRVYDKMTWTYIHYRLRLLQCTGMWSPILANDVSCTVIWPWCPDRAFIKAIEGGTPLFSEYSSSQHWSLVVVGLTDFSRTFFFLENISYIVWDIRNREREKKKVLTNFIYIFHCRAPCQ